MSVVYQWQERRAITMFVSFKPLSRNRYRVLVGVHKFFGRTPNGEIVSKKKVGETRSKFLNYQYTPSAAKLLIATDARKLNFNSSWSRHSQPTRLAITCPKCNRCVETSDFAIERANNTAQCSAHCCRAVFRVMGYY